MPYQAPRWQHNSSNLTSLAMAGTVAGFGINWSDDVQSELHNIQF